MRRAGDAAWLEEPASPAAGTLPRDDRTSVITLTLFAVVAAGAVAVVIAVLRHAAARIAGIPAAVERILPRP
ncbi:hypothetical protein Drose_21940 [Dactylosporangium roseum]|uniref:Two-component sensor histidine kinase n=2 Tax=Dactylosporangium roseum TaxID=47989 RepID=A0ABY5Z0B7_9ACTN|nr:hypothetical protein [Dactylosporangium roseum]UWZ33929.1 hypothetical protein Drose_21940 [Dactylosporangium roseum]